MQAHVQNSVFDLEVDVHDDRVWIKLQDRQNGGTVVDDEYIYRIHVPGSEGVLTYIGLKSASCYVDEDGIRIQGYIAGLQINHTLSLPLGEPALEEQLVFENTTDSTIHLKNVEMGFQCRITDDAGQILSEVASHRLTAIPFKHKATDPEYWDNTFFPAELLIKPGGEHRATAELGYGYFPALHRASEGWAWEMGERTLGIFKFNQTGIEFSVIALEPHNDGVRLRFGGAAMVDGEPSYLSHIDPGQAVSPGVTRYEKILPSGGYHKAAYAFRCFLDRQGCRFPCDYNPPIHWNELYDNPEWNIHTPGSPMPRKHTRSMAYTRELMRVEAAKAVEYNAESLYLDPGWDTDFGTLIWGEEWLGPRRAFIQEILKDYGLKVSLHCPLATWMSLDGRGVPSWPREAFRMDASGEVIEGSVCLGSRQYLDAATERLLGHCEDGVTFFMFDGNWWNGGCWNPDHGHPVPYTKEDHCRANLELAGRIHERYPHVIIEMHDMITGGTRQRYTPVYYKYGLPHSYDENWGFELMWQPMEDLLSGRARCLYYYNLACNVPIYLHIDLRDDNEHCLSLWWYASTCRHLGIGGTHRDPMIAEAQKRAMKLYRKLKPFYTRGEFYGSDECPEEVHFHVLKEKNAVVMNLFNLRDEPRVLSGSISFEQLGLDPNQWYIVPAPHVSLWGGRLSWNRRLPPYGTDVLQIWPIDVLTKNRTRESDRQEVKESGI